MRAFLMVLLAAAAAFAADDPWAKVRELKSGAEIRVIKKGSAQPVLGKFDELRDESLSLVVKNEQIAIPKDQIERLDARPSQTGSRIKTETTGKVSDPDPRPQPGMNHGPAVPGKTITSGVSIGSKPDFETIYRRQPAAPAKK